MKGAMTMGSTRVRGVVRVLLAAAVAAVLPACSDDSGTNPSSGSQVNTPLLWNPPPTSGGGVNATSPLLWIDPSTAGGGGFIPGADVTYGMAWPTQYPATNPNYTHPVSVSTPANGTFEANLEGYAALLFNQVWPINVGGGGLGGGGGQIGQRPFYNTGTNLRRSARGNCAHRSIHNPTEPESLAMRLTACAINFAAAPAPQEAMAEGAGMTDTQAWNAMQGAVGGWMASANVGEYTYGGAGFWPGTTINYYNFTFVWAPLGMTP